MTRSLAITAAHITLACGLIASAVTRAPAADETKPPRPNIVFILCDDLGYGDVRCLNPQGKIATPQLDALAKEGMIFTDAHSGSSVCTPTRYGVMTGRYAWRTKLQNGVLGGLSPRLIEPERLTVASLLKSQGYHTACIGKWHLGMDWVKQAGKDVTPLGIEPAAQVWNVDYAQPYANGPLSVGFDYYFGIAASLDMVPYTFLENDRVTVVPTVEKMFPMMLGKGGRNTRLGPAAPEFEAADVLPRLTEQAVKYIQERGQQPQPFFLYLPLASPHTPIVPTSEWQGKSGLNPYADFVMQTDHCIGQVLTAIEAVGQKQNTLVIVTSDNGCSPEADYAALLAKEHNPSHRFRGHKADIFDGGHRVPFLARWPQAIPAGSTSSQLVCLTDLLATAAELTAAKVPETAGEDSFSFAHVWNKKSTAAARTAIVHHSINGSFAIRRGDWKLSFCAGSGGWSEPRPGSPATAKLPEMQLYHLADDMGEERNVQSSQPQKVAELTELMEQYVAAGRSTPGAKQANAVEVDFRRGMKVAAGGAKKK
jgi:arylsulfatase A-like enzyme